MEISMKAEATLGAEAVLVVEKEVELLTKAGLGAEAV